MDSKAMFKHKHLLQEMCREITILFFSLWSRALYLNQNKTVGLGSQVVSGGTLYSVQTVLSLNMHIGSWQFLVNNLTTSGN
jgi:hypothetical protein